MDNEQLPIRKRLRLWEHDYSQRGYYFLTLCTYNRQQLFVNSTVNDEMQIVPSDYPQNQLIEKWLSKLEERFQVIVDQYVIMTDHVHLILAIDRQAPPEGTSETNSENDCRERPMCRSESNHQESIQKMIQWFKTMTTNEYIQKVKSGDFPPFEKQMWQKSYYDHIIRNYDDYASICFYIVNNPIKAQQKSDSINH